MSNPRQQIPNNIQIQRINAQNVSNLIFGAWNLFGI
jgi:hypothetical protein